MGILVTGATGVLGRMLVGALVSAGHEVTAFVRSSARIAELPEHIRIIYGDIRESEAVKAAVSAGDIVFHMASMMRRHRRGKSEYEEINVSALRELIRLAGQIGVARFIYTSSFFALGPSGDHPQKEAEPRRSFDFLGDFERSMTLAKRVARSASKRGFPIVTLYTGVMYGPGELPAGYGVAAQILEFLQGRFRGYPYGGEAMRSYAYLPDIVAGHVAAMERATLGKEYILGGENLKLVDFYETLSDLTDIPVPSSSNSQWKAEFRIFARSLFNVLSGKQPTVIPEEIEMLKQDWTLSSDRAVRELDYRITPFRDGLSQTVKWLKERYPAGASPSE